MKNLLRGAVQAFVVGLVCSAPGHTQDAASFGAFVPTGPLIPSRSFHSSARLDDGRVLVVGGQGLGTDCFSTHFYDPETNRFTQGPPLQTGRFGWSTATRLHDGRVLVSGGVSCFGNAILSSAELYDPVTNSFTLTGDMAQERFDHEATLLPDGRVLVTAGLGFGENPLAEIYDPATGSFASAGSMHGFHLGGGATLLDDGTVLIIGGVGSERVAEIYDPASGTFDRTGDLRVARPFSPTATLLDDGSVLVIGGDSRTLPLLRFGGTAEIFDPVAGTFRATNGELLEARSNHSATRLSSGAVLIVGGALTSYAELYDPVLGLFLPTGPNLTPRTSHTATSLADGRVVVIGGDRTPVGVGEVYVHP